MLRQKFDHQGSPRKAQASEMEQARILRLVQSSTMNLDVRLQGPTLSVETLLELTEGDVIAFDFPVDVR